jgi:RNase H-like domain found in reverse transcriptase/Integrase core domain/Integrase zinc binding domain
VWSPEWLAVVEAAKQAVAQATHLVHPLPGAEISLFVDASADHVGAALQQRAALSDPWRPLGFFSKKLEPVQTRYSAFDQELWACFAGIQHFRHMLEGRRFAVYTDHKLLTQALHCTSDPWTARQCRQLAYIAEFTSDIQHVAGRDNVVPDTLSRPPPTCAVTSNAAEGSALAFVAVVAADDSLLDYAAIAARQKQCLEVAAAVASSALRVIPVMFNDSEVYWDFSTGTARPLIPAADKKQVFLAFHTLAHPGIRASRLLLAARVVWKGMAADINRWCRDCQQCQRGKVTQQPSAAVQAIPVPEKRFHHIHVDMVGPLPVSKEGFTYMLTAIDRTTRWLEVTPMKNMDAVTCADALVTSWITRFGVPAMVTTDRGTQFTSAVWTGLCRRLGITQLYTTAYHPQANGMVERAHRQIKDALRSRQAGNCWPEHLPWVLLGLRASPKDDSALSSAELVYGSPLVLPGQFPRQDSNLVTAVEPPPQQQPPLPTRKLSYAQAAARTPWL